MLKVLQDQQDQGVTQVLKGRLDRKGQLDLRELKDPQVVQVTQGLRAPQDHKVLKGRVVEQVIQEPKVPKER